LYIGFFSQFFKKKKARLTCGGGSLVLYNVLRFLAILEREMS